MAKSSSKFLIATVLGVAAGIGIGILIAPAKGSKTRQRMKKKIFQMAESTEEEFSEKFQKIKSELAGKSEGNTKTDIPEDQSSETKT